MEDNGGRGEYFIARSPGELIRGGAVSVTECCDSHIAALSRLVHVRKYDGVLMLLWPNDFLSGAESGRETPPNILLLEL